MAVKPSIKINVTVFSLHPTNVVVFPGYSGFPIHRLGCLELETFSVSKVGPPPPPPPPPSMNPYSKALYDDLSKQLFKFPSYDDLSKQFFKFPSYDDQAIL